MGIKLLLGHTVDILGVVSHPWLNYIHLLYTLYVYCCYNFVYITLIRNRHPLLYVVNGINFFITSYRLYLQT